MYEYGGPTFIQGAEKALTISFMIRQMMLEGCFREDEYMDSGTIGVLRVQLTAAAAFFDGMGARATRDAAIRTSQFLNQRLLVRDVDYAVQSLRGVFQDEVASWHVLILNEKDAVTYNHGERDVFGQDVLDAFPSALPHIGESCKCYALNRWTASTYHCMGVIEFGIKALCRELNTTVDLDSYDTTWEKMRRGIEKQLSPFKDPNAPGGSSPAPRKLSNPATWDEDEAFFFGLVNDIKAIQKAYRNPSMHFRTIHDSDEQQAKRVLESTSGFMQDLVLKVHE